MDRPSWELHQYREERRSFSRAANRSAVNPLRRHFATRRFHSSRVAMHPQLRQLGALRGRWSLDGYAQSNRPARDLGAHWVESTRMSNPADCPTDLESVRHLEKVRNALDHLRRAEASLEAGRQALADVPGKGAKTYARLLALSDGVRKEQRALLALRDTLARKV